MLEILFRLETVAGHAALWITVFCAAVIATFLVFIRNAMQAIFDATDPWQQQLRYQVFRDLIDLFRGWGRK